VCHLAAVYRACCVAYIDCTWLNLEAWDARCQLFLQELAEIAPCVPCTCVPSQVVNGKPAPDVFADATISPGTWL
jgi:hypothetical protein